MARYFRDAVPFRILPAAISTAVLIGLWLIPTPEGLTPKAWGLVAIFLTTIVAIILKVMPIGVMALMAIVIVALSQVTSGSSKGAMADALGVDRSRFPLTLPQYGNMGPAAVPFTLARHTGSFRPDDRILLLGIGSGLNTSYAELVW